MIFHPSIMHRKLSFGVYDVQFPSSVEAITVTGEGMVSHSIVWCGTVWFVMVWTINVETTTVTGAGAVSRSRQHFSSKHPDMSCSVPMSHFHSTFQFGYVYYHKPCQNVCQINIDTTYFFL